MGALHIYWDYSMEEYSMGAIRDCRVCGRCGAAGYCSGCNRVGLRVRELRMIRGVSQAELAFRASVSRSCLVNIEGECRGVKCESLRKVIAALDLSIRDFFEDERFAQIDSTQIIHLR